MNDSDTVATIKTHLGEPGAYPFTRGIYKKMYTEQPWTMRQYAGFGSAQESNQRYRYLLSQGTTGLSVAFDLPTQLGLDPDDALAIGEVGRVGVSIATIDDMRELFDTIPLDQVTTSMTINAPAMMLLALYIIVSQEKGIALHQLSGTVQNDILKEYIARGTYIYPPKPSMRLITDMFAYCTQHLPKWNTISISGYHIREAGSSAVQEIAFTLANARAYVRAALERGLELDQFAPRLSFFFACHTDILEEIAKFRAVRRMWARMMREEFGAKNPKSWTLRFHTQTGGSTLTAQQPEVNIVRTAYQALAAVLGGTQSLHTNAYDEALGLPTEASATLALRTQQVLAFESGITTQPDPLAGSFWLEEKTNLLERRAREIIAKIEALGGAIAATESGFIQRNIEESAFKFQQQIESGERTVIGVNAFQTDTKATASVHKIDPQVSVHRSEQLRAYRAARDQNFTDTALEHLRNASKSTSNLMPFVLDAFHAKATLGEICGVLRTEWGEYQPA